MVVVVMPCTGPGWVGSTGGSCAERTSVLAREDNRCTGASRQRVVMMVVVVPCTGASWVRVAPSACAEWTLAMAGTEWTVTGHRGHSWTKAAGGSVGKASRKQAGRGDGLARPHEGDREASGSEGEDSE